MSFKLRIPYSEESGDCAKLIYVSGPDLYRYSFFNNIQKIYELIEFFFNKRNTIFSKENIIVEEENGKIRGLLLFCPASELSKLGKNMLKHVAGMIRISGISHFFRTIFRLRINNYFPGTEDDELFISNLAVFEEYRGKGIAVKLLNKAVEIALEKGLDKLSLYVEIDNSRAKRVYEKFGFKDIKKTFLPKEYHRYGIIGFHKMIKEVKEN